MVDVNWLYEFRLYTLTLPAWGWLVDLEHSRTVTYLNGRIPVSLWERGVHAVTVPHLRSEDRFITTRLGEQLAGARLAEGDRAIGLRYGSKHGSDWDCWTVWLRDGVMAAVAVDDGSSVRPPHQNPVLSKVLETYNLTAR